MPGATQHWYAGLFTIYPGVWKSHMPHTPASFPGTHPSLQGLAFPMLPPGPSPIPSNLTRSPCIETFRANGVAPNFLSGIGIPLSNM